MKVIDVMSKMVEVVPATATLHETARIMKENDCGCVVVVDDDRLVGMITDRDLAIRCLAEKEDPAEMTAGRVMTPEILYCHETDDADDVVRNMALNKVRRLPVLNAEKRLVGIVSLGDLAAHANHELCGMALQDICRTA